MQQKGHARSSRSGRRPGPTLDRPGELCDRANCLFSPREVILSCERPCTNVCGSARRPAVLRCEQYLMPSMKTFVLPSASCSNEMPIRTTSSSTRPRTVSWAIGVPEEYGGGGSPDPRFLVTVAEEFVRAGHLGHAVRVVAHAGVAAPLIAEHATAETCAQWLPGLATGVTPVGIGRTALRVTTSGDELILYGHAHSVIDGPEQTLTACLRPCRRRCSGVGRYNVSRHRPHRHSDPASSGRCKPSRPDIRRSQSAGQIQTPSRGSGGFRQRRPPVAGSSRRRRYSVLLSTPRSRTSKNARCSELPWTSESTKIVLGEALAQCEAAETLIDAVIAERVSSTLTTERSAVAKLQAIELFSRISDQGMQLHGGTGHLEYPISQLFADARYFRVGKSTQTLHAMERLTVF